MRFVGSILFSILMVIVPAVQAQACICNPGVASTTTSAAPDSTNCCCEDSASCPCSGCSGHDGSKGDTGSLAGCVCTHGEPQMPVEQADDIASDDAPSHAGLRSARDAQTAIELVCTVEGGFRPPAFRPLLL
jgi:hypothetical protein